MKNNQSYIDHAHQQNFLVKLSQFNIQRGKLFAAIIIGIELVLLLIDLFSRSVITSFNFDLYAFMYILMIVVTGLLWIFFLHLEKKLEINFSLVKVVNLTTIFYLTFFMTWGAFISLLDQSLYGNIVVFLVNMLVGALIFNISNNHILIPQLLSCLVFMIGLPYFQPSRDILIGHYVNVCIFLILSWVIARTNYLNYVENFLNQRIIEEKSFLLSQMNDNLLSEIQSRKQAQKELEAANEQLVAISSLDALTGIPNRRKLDEFLLELWATAVRNETSISVMMIDIDFFKLYNDTYGHLAGDNCLRAVASVLNGCRREGKDFVARYGGEEFLFISAGLNKDKTLLLGERIRRGIEALGLSHSISTISPNVTVSIGISYLIPISLDSITESIEHADQAMYRAKQNGRNRVTIAE